jgi:GNAT superfamily N-acetyltransferase
MPRQPDDGLVIAEYVAGDSDECLALERLCIQGDGYRLSFRRRVFHRRAENFRTHRLIVGRMDGRLVGVGAVALKDVVLHGEPLRAAFYFDLRVHPEYRRRRIGRRIFDALTSLAEQDSRFGYSSIMADNARAHRMAVAFQTRVLGTFAYLVLPTYRERTPRTPVAHASMQETHAELLRVAPPWDLYTNPLEGGRTDAWVSSFIARDGHRIGGCSVWDNREILGEVVEALPPMARVAGRLFRAWPLSRAHLPHLPVAGEMLRSWYLFDVFGTDPDIAVDVVRRVTAEARECGIDWCHVPHVAGDIWVEALRDEVPHPFAPRVPYHLLGASRRGPVALLQRIYVDIRDL